MKKLFHLLLLIIPFTGESQSKDLKAEINQTAFDKIINSISYPYKAYEHSEPFPGFFKDVNETGISDISTESEENKNYTSEELKTLFKWAVENTRTTSMTGGKEEEVFKSALKNAWENLRKEIQEAINSNSGSKQEFKGMGDNYTLDDLKKWNSFTTVEELFDAIQKAESRMVKSGFDAKAHLAYARVDILQAPRIIVNSPSFDINGISVKPTATGELWVKLPHLKCCGWFGPFCTCYRLEWRWHRVASLTVSPKIGADANVTFAIDGMKIFAGTQFKKLFLNYPILREINFAGIVNRGIAGKKFEVYDVSKFVASIPYINKKFRISEILLPPSNGSVIVQVNVTQTN